ncbi:DUF3800 domain-containing protein [Sphaerisporangium viridialbum]|uniref:DUF3800 domain-containing protein n=1 Tax=Sphaerisporangium viridialbum TaxID=46189 RepID=UPI003C765E0F
MTSTPDLTSPDTMRMFYIDDSGSESSGWIVYSWIECTSSRWNAGLRGWLDLRKQFSAQFAIPTSTEIHSTSFAGGRGNPSMDADWNRHKRNRGEVMRMALTQIGSAPELRVGSLYRRTTETRKEYAAQRADVYEKLVDHVDARLGAAGEHGIIFMDGDGTDTSYARAHRGLKLDHRNLIEDPLFQHSKRNQWIQMADIVAWSAFQYLQRSPSRSFAWDWYPTYLLPRDVNGAPLAV